MAFLLLQQLLFGNLPKPLVLTRISLEIVPIRRKIHSHQHFLFFQTTYYTCLKSISSGSVLHMLKCCWGHRSMRFIGGEGTRVVTDEKRRWLSVDEL
ncbi:hypothetical protein BDB00DRAFT_818609 [Zychaea mexicana]|uniref:uncharacterized protein n=1 Tax=Zychaea mexicana TaxID=64656 RepID=UPI0022FF419B|nr:uncharacterized protein BDB00DRAFT_818609 [Zychaea mexicana]KAI9494573.1 hypothetical protein BDB00DRAFT_818609 [Zychaea mexicana]